MQTSIERAKLWVERDPNEKTREFVNSLIKSDTGESSSGHLASLFPSDGSRIGFGTAGLRAAMKAGPLGMNDLVIIQTTQGLARYCERFSQGNGNGDKKLIAVIGYDHRENPELNLSSKSFALLAKMVLLEAGFECVLLDGYVATPLVAYATTKLNAATGIMVTASHNPMADAGFKVYWSDGCQIRPPFDELIADSILENLQPWTDYGTKLKETIAMASSCVDSCYGLGNADQTLSITNDYFNSVRNSGLVTNQNAASTKAGIVKPKIAYTAMHGVGHVFAVKSFEIFNLDPFYSVPEQQEPDYTFPTVSFPNPEEKGALTLATKFADEHGCVIVLANDPDADRLAVAEKCRKTKEWSTFTGDQIGTMLGHWIWESIGKDCEKPVAMCASTVSSKMLGAIAKAEGFTFVETLTGFKWIGSQAVKLGLEGYRTLFLYEEAIGFCCGDVVADKDGLTAMGVMAELALNVYRGGLSLTDHMESLYAKYGIFESRNGYYFCYEPSTVHKIIDNMRNGGTYMDSVGPYEVESIRDLGEPGYDSTSDDKKPSLPTSKSSPMITLKFTNGVVAQFRASGTEPKFKYYIEIQGKPGVRRDVIVKELETMTAFILEELLRPSENDLVPSKL
eukprot:CAMPEP_0194113942 /NCGR_PEP_ID=MMETSP0150-20130528/18437_1 /TAXON_ID=122233 /ORGANISM="Chaetoceros debilis, Strain MM31A-1" /LENGTH=621 /DNA_ID=CAMNT_0038804009 /DNA_START=161 /DNA_END=2026 /DNA_ORIENTATION=+